MEVTLDLVKFKVCEGGGKIHISPQLYCLMILQVYSFFDPQNLFAKLPKLYTKIFFLKRFTLHWGVKFLI